METREAIIWEEFSSNDCINLLENLLSTSTITDTGVQKLIQYRMKQFLFKFS